MKNKYGDSFKLIDVRYLADISIRAEFNEYRNK